MDTLDKNEFEESVLMFCPTFLDMRSVLQSTREQ